MRDRNAQIVVGTGLILFCSTVANADVSMTWGIKNNSGFEKYVSKVINLYAHFDGSDPATNFLTGVGGLPGEEGFVATYDGVFYQNALGGRTAPNALFFPVVPGLPVDTFVTVGAKAFNTPTVGVDATQLTPGFPTEDGVPQPGGSWSPTHLQFNDAAWFVTPDDLQGHVGHADNGPDTVLIGQFSVAAGAQYGIFGQLRVQGVNNGQAFVSHLGFDIAHPYPPAPGSLGLLCVAGVLGPHRRRREAGGEVAKATRSRLPIR